MSGEQQLIGTIARLQETDRFEFEHFIAEIFTAAGWETEVTQKSGDDGIDVIAQQYGIFQRKASIQVKRPNRGNKVGKGDVIKYSSLDRNDIHTDIPIIATTAPFTRGAYDFARKKNVKLIDGATLAGFIHAHSLNELVNEYAPQLEELDVNYDTVFSPNENAREAYFRERPVEVAAKLFSKASLLETVDYIQNAEVGRFTIEGMARLCLLIEGDNKMTPLELFQEYPHLLDQNWYNVRCITGAGEIINQSAEFSLSPPENAEVLCTEHQRGVSVQVFMSPEIPVGPTEFTYLGDCVDFLADADSVEQTVVGGSIFGSSIKGLDRKLERHGSHGFDALSYHDLLHRTVRSNSELLSATEPYFRASEDKEMLERIMSLQDIAQSDP